MTIPFNKSGYDEFIDFLKGYCILCVVLAHCLPDVVRSYSLFCLWGDMQIPLFLMIQVFHAYKKEEYYSIKKRLLPTAKRIVVPFMLTMAVALMLKVAIGGIDNTLSQLGTIVCAGGIGPGSYYMWIYLQFFFLLPLLHPILQRADSKIGGVIY